jgi:hypothetical protein
MSFGQFIILFYFFWGGDVNRLPFRKGTIGLFSTFSKEIKMLEVKWEFLEFIKAKINTLTHKWLFYFPRSQNVFSSYYHINIYASKF